jgi:nucleotide-binding universal stress UspA family protein
MNDQEAPMTPRIKKVLVPTDFSAPSDLALEYGKSLAEQFGASLLLLHVIEDPFIAGAWSSEIYVADMPQLRDSLRREAESRLARLVSPAERERLRITTEVIVGSAAQAIREVAADRGVDLLVMGTHGRSGMAHLLLGSVAEKMVRIAPCPVLTVRGDARVGETAAETHEPALAPSPLA